MKTRDGQGDTKQPEQDSVRTASSNTQPNPEGTAWITMPRATVIAAAIAALGAVASAIFSAVLSEQAKKQVEAVNERIVLIEQRLTLIQHNTTNIINQIAAQCPTPGNVDVEAAGKQAETDTKNALASLPKAMHCREHNEGDDHIVELTAEAELYPENEYLVSKSPQATQAVGSLADALRALKNMQQNVIKEYDLHVTGTFRGKADSENIGEPHRYEGRPLSVQCEASEIRENAQTESEAIPINSSSLLTNNRLLACARSAQMGEALIQAGYPDESNFDFSGYAYAYGPTDGQNRAVDVILKIKNIRKIKRDFKVCPA